MRLTLYRALEAFLAANLGSRQPVAPPVDRAIR